eukprot:Skav228683  [mRNA]  locus=scaffold111:87828:94995:- [translate_table: standard]
MGDRGPSGIRDLISALSRLSLSLERAQSSSSSTAPEWEVVGDEVVTTLLLEEINRVPVGDYEGFAQLLPACPTRLIATCGRLSSAAASSEFRARRAFEAGFWARIVLLGKLSQPRATPQLDLTPTVYVVLRARSLDSPTHVSSYSDLRRIIGRVDSEAVYHGFPSLTEARIYCEGAGVQWPASVDLDEPFPVHAFVVMQRQGGLLMAFPGTGITDEMLEAFSVPLQEGEEPLVGQSARFFVPLRGGADFSAEDTVEVLVVDLANPPAEQLFEPLTEDLPDFPFAMGFTEEANLAVINMENLLLQVKEWLGNELGDRMAFYSAHEEEEELQAEPAANAAKAKAKGLPKAPGGTSTSAPKGAPKTAAPKRQTVGTLAVQVEQILGVLPTITQQLQVLTDRQSRIDGAQSSHALVPSPIMPSTPYRNPSAARAKAAVSSLLQTPVPKQNVAAMLGPPPQIRSGRITNAPTAAVRNFPEDDPVFLDEDPDPASSNQYMQVLLSQSRALNALVAQMNAHQSDPLARWSSAQQPGSQKQGQTKKETGRRRRGESAGLVRSTRQCSSLVNSLSQEKVVPRLSKLSSGDRPGDLANLLEQEASTPQRQKRGNLADFSMSFSKWCYSIIRWVLATRTRFGRYLASVLCLRRDGQVAAPTALFPLPLPDQYAVEPVEPSMSRAEKRRRMHNRPLLVVICALNFTYCSQANFPLELLRRQPNAIQAQAIESLRLLVRASDPGSPFGIATSGRKNLTLLARLNELFTAADALGFGSNPYHDTVSGVVTQVDNSWDPRLQPFRALDPDRLKISGQGQWDAAQYIEDELWMPFVEPQVLELDTPIETRGLPDLEQENEEDVRKLLLKWDTMNLLELHSARTVGPGPEGKVKIFNAAKSSDVDRQIGDRRWRNALESRIEGPSKHLPTGASICKILLPPRHGVRISITDRSDYYRQIACTYERSRSNLLWPPMQLGDFKGTQAYDRYLARAKTPFRKIDRTVFGDDLAGLRFHDRDVSDTCQVFGGFRSVLQGDQLGVEFGISAHLGLLIDKGVISLECLLSTKHVPKPRGLYQGLVIDDFFCLAPVPADHLRKPPGTKPNAALDSFHKAKHVYKSEGLQGSDQKDVVDSVSSSVVGAHINSKPHFVQRGIVPVGSPPEKRLSLAWITLKSASLGYTTGKLHSSIVGSLVSAFCFRRVLMSVLQEVFHVLPMQYDSDDSAELVPLSRSQAGELVLASVLLPVACSNLLAQVSPIVYSSDASNAKGAFCKTEVGSDVAKALWLTGDFKGSRTYLQSWPHAFMKHHFDTEPEDWTKWDGEIPSMWDQDEAFSGSLPVDRPLAQFYDFIEICGGSGVLSDEMNRRGYNVGPVIDISYSKHYDMLQCRGIQWVLFLIQHNRVRAFAVEPPCTTFSPAAHPAVRSYKVPRGFCPQQPKTWVGNRLCFGGLTMILCAAHADVIGLFETPRRSKMAWLQEWQYLLSLPNVQEVTTASCMFGSPHQKEFRFLTCNMNASPIHRKCSRDHVHIKIEGAITKGTAVYTPGLVYELGHLFAKHLDFQADLFSKCDVEVNGLEEPLSCELSRCAKWTEGSSWKWTGKSHINILELAAYFQAFKDAAKKGGGRVSFLVDSSVTLFCTSKGRSSSRALAPLLRKIMAIAIAFGVYGSNHYTPTRLNVSDDPTRDEELRSPSRRPVYEGLSTHAVYALAELPKLRRWISNWTSLLFGLHRRGGFEFPGFSFDSWRLRQTGLPISLHQAIMDFDSTLGFPGEGPFFCGLLCRFWLSTCVCLPLCVPHLGLTFSHGMQPRNLDDEVRAERRKGNLLTYGRPVLQVTKKNREKLITDFRCWLEQKGVSLDELLGAAFSDPEHLCRALSEYGSQLFQSGRPYSHYSETINAIGSVRPALRRLLTGAWDLAFTWLREEPFEHHLACPFQVLLAILSVAICWGWPEVAGVVCLSWAGICRIGEVLAATRKDLVLPVDVLGTSASVLLRVQEPKTRFRAARHQIAKVDYSDMVELIQCIFRNLRPNQKLWPFSPQQLRKRFRQILSALDLPSQSRPGHRALDLGSLRAGGATFLQMLCEDSELVRRRGRWLAGRTMEVYLQEAAATVFFPHLPQRTKERIMSAANSFPDFLDRLKFWTENYIPPSTWYLLSNTQTEETDGTKWEAQNGGQRMHHVSTAANAAWRESSAPKA